MFHIYTAAATFPIETQLGTAKQSKSPIIQF